jgi:hypothetical protein
MDLDHYQTLAQVAVTLVGFSGIVAIFSDRLNFAKDSENRMRLIDLLLAGFGTVFLSFLPYLLISLELGPPGLWRLSNLVIAGWFAFSLLLIRRVAKAPFNSLSYPIATVAFAIIGTILIIALVISALGVIESSASALNFFALIFLLSVATMQFCILLIKGLSNS